MDEFSTSNLPDGFSDLVNSSSDEQRKCMLVYLQNINFAKSKKVFPKNINCSDYVDHIKQFTSDSVLRDTIVTEVTDMGLLKKSGKNKVNTQWLSMDNRPYCYSDNVKFKHVPKPIAKYPGITKLVELVNNDNRTSMDSNTALIQVYNTKDTKLGFHNDAEQLIDQQSSISVVSFGASRTIEFCPQDNLNPKYRKADYSVEISDSDLYIMKPGCQEVLLHRVAPGNNNTSISGDDWRISISVRKTVNVADVSIDSEVSTDLQGSITPISCTAKPSRKKSL